MNVARVASLLALAILALATIGCGSMIPGSEKVVFTRNPADVANSKLIVPTRYYSYRPMYGIHNDKAIKDAVYSEGGDTVLLVKPILYAATGIAYNCHGEDPRHPFPVDSKPEAVARASTTTPQPALAVGTKLFSNDGAPFGTVVLTSDTSAAVSLVGGGTVTMTIEQAVGMQTKKDPVTTAPPAESPAPAAALAPAPALAPAAHSHRRPHRHPREGSHQHRNQHRQHWRSEVSSSTRMARCSAL